MCIRDSNGSERFAEKHRFGFFPAAGVAWIASKESFLADHTAHWLSFLKFRFSWGKVGNDGVINEPHFTHLPLLKPIQASDPSPDGQNLQTYEISSYPNDKITWEIAEQMNLGIETKLFGGIVEINADFYQEIRHNILDYRYTCLLYTSVGAGILKHGLLSVDYLRQTVYFQPFDEVAVKDDVVENSVTVEAGKVNEITGVYFRENIHDYLKGTDFIFCLLYTSRCV